MARAVLQGVSFAIADATDGLKQAGARPERLMATGGGSGNQTWLSYIASLTGISIDLPAEDDFGTAFGAARLAMLADGAEIAEVCHKPDIKLTIDPDASLADRLNPARNDWQQIYQLLKAEKPPSKRIAVYVIFQVLFAGAHNRRYLQLNFYRCFTAKLEEYSLNVSEQLLLKNDIYP